ncbi:MAG: hypothetical protein ACD_46C00314G0007 [uncultured bacterium]|nr:MAG: hypothetical protein ACD_46C00314G0007 [uncultured bacterium]
MSLVNVYNEWDPIEEIIVGTALHAAMPHTDKGFQTIQQATHDLFDALSPGEFPQKIIDETEEDIQIFINELIKLNITVKRPEATPFKEKIKTIDWEANHYFCYCPRDVLLAIGDSIIETPNVFRSRYFETVSYKNILLEYMKSGAKWLSAPKPRLLDEIYNQDDPNQLALKNLEPVFDAANILRAGKDIFYLISDSGNELGCQWLQTILGEKFTVHPCHKLYSSMHIDSTISLLRPGLALVNPARVNENNIPELLKKWDILTAPEMIEYQYSNHGSFSTKWLGMNLLMLSPQLAVVDKHQTPLIKLLEKNGIDVLPLLLRHGRTLGGGFHCITLDVRRKCKLENYF